MAEYTDIDEALANPLDCTILSLSTSPFEDMKPLELPASISTLENLEEIELSNFLQLTFPPEIVLLKKLRKLDITDCPYDVVPAELFDIESLNDLAFSAGRKEKNLSSSIKKLKNLKKLNIYGFEKLCPEIGLLKRLEVLDLSYNDLTDIPREIAELKSLISLDLSANFIYEVPLPVLKLTQLEHLSINNVFEHMDKDGKSKKKMQQIRQAYCTLSNLKSLSFVHQHIISVSSNIRELKHLESLSLGYNKMGQVPAEVFLNPHLSFLDLCFNDLTELPKEIGTLTNLEVLHLHGNKLTSVASVLKPLKKLRKLLIHKKSFSEEEISLIEKDHPGIKIK